MNCSWTFQKATFLFPSLEFQIWRKLCHETTAKLSEHHKGSIFFQFLAQRNGYWCTCEISVQLLSCFLVTLVRPPSCFLLVTSAMTESSLLMWVSVVKRCTSDTSVGTGVLSYVGCFWAVVETWNEGLTTLLKVAQGSSKWNLKWKKAFVLHQEADLAVAPLTVTAVREQFVDMATPFIQTGLSFILRRDAESEESTFSLLSPFSTDMWVGVLIAFLLTALCMFLVGR